MVALAKETTERLLPSVRKVEYAWKPNSRVPVRPDVAGAALDDIERKRNGLRPLEVVQEARQPKSPLHPAFEWDDVTAAHAYRLDQAEYLLRNLVRRVVVEGQAPVETRAYVVVTRQDAAGEVGERVYVRVEEAMAQDGYRKEVLNRALTELRAWRDRYERLRELADLIAVIDRRLSQA